MSHATAISTFPTMSAALTAAQEDQQAKQLGGFAVIQVDEERYGCVATDSPLGTLGEIAGGHFCGRGHIVGRKEWNGATWERLKPDAGLKERAVGDNATYAKVQDTSYRPPPHADALWERLAGRWHAADVPV